MSEFYIIRASAKKARELIGFNRNQLRITMRSLTLHNHLNENLFKVGHIDSAGCGKCKQAIETASHAPYD
jgi:hypothetical protein